MKKLTLVAALCAVTALTACGTASVAPEAGSNTWKGTDGTVWMNGTNEYCWNNNFWTPETGVQGCDGVPAPAAAPVAKAPVAAPAAPVAVAPTAPAVEKVSFAADAFFDVNKSALKTEGKTKLSDLAGKVAGLNLEVIVATGHTDSDASDAYNQALSMRRAEAVKAYLVSKGIEASRIYTEGKGEAQPVASNSTAAGKAQNRRVEIEVVGTNK